MYRIGKSGGLAYFRESTSCILQNFRLINNNNEKKKTFRYLSTVINVTSDDPNVTDNEMTPNLFSIRLKTTEI